MPMPRALWWSYGVGDILLVSWYGVGDILPEVHLYSIVWIEVRRWERSVYGP